MTTRTWPWTAPLVSVALALVLITPPPASGFDVFRYEQATKHRRPRASTPPLPSR